MGDPLDDAFRELGRGLPFEVDWEAYERQMLARLHRTRMGRRRAATWAALAGAAAGAAATLILSVALWSGRAERAASSPLPTTPAAAPASETAVPPVAAPVYRLAGNRRSAGPRAMVETAAEGAGGAPFRRIVRREDGSTGEMVFYGFSEGGETSSFIAAGRGAPR
jgi:hypothetical protein